MKYQKMLIGFSVIILVWAYGNISQQTWLGSLDTLFSGLAFVGLIVTIIQQQSELQQNTQALLAQKQEMSNQWKEMERQNTNIKRQRFETTLFSMYNLHFATLNAMTVKGNTGILAFREFVNSAIQSAQAIQKTSHPNHSQTDIYSSSLLQAVPKAEAQTDFSTIMEPYLNSLKLIYNSIKQADLQDDATARYILIMKSYLTNFEVMFLVLHFNHLKSQGSEGELTSMYNDLELNSYFAYRIRRRYNLDVKVDSTLV